LIGGLPTPDVFKSRPLGRLFALQGAGHVFARGGLRTVEEKKVKKILKNRLTLIFTCDRIES
jgi:hypothetical protein